jgi:hypothetical protein
LRVLLINKTASPVQAVLRSRLPVGSSGTVIRLTAAGVRAVGGVRLAGQRIGGDGRLHGRRRTFSVRQSGGAFELRVPGYTAELLELPSS